MNPAFFARDAATVATELIGTVLVHETPERRIAGRIVETEAYYGEDDPASHAANGSTPRNAVMYGPPGHSYVYLCYGMHRMINAVTGADGEPSAVLIRALEPCDGVDAMKTNRGKQRKKTLCDGPGKLCEALGIEDRHNDAPLWNGSVRIESGEQVPQEHIESSGRIGVSEGADRQLRFYERDSEYVSR